jgi:uncharacterized membrane protein
MARKLLLVCGILSSLLYLFLNLYVPTRFEGYDWRSQTVSELSAVEAPTRQLWMVWGTLYTLLIAAFGWGVQRSAFGNRALHRAGMLLLVYGFIGLFWPPMHLRGNPMTLTDVLHIAFAAVTVLFMFLIMGFGASALGKTFRRYTIATLVVFAVFGALTGMESPGIAANTPTPNIGLWERINIAAYMLWVVVFAVVLLRRTSPPGTAPDVP